MSCFSKDDCVKFIFLKDEKKTPQYCAEQAIYNAKYQKVSYVTCMVFKLIELILRDIGL